MRILDEKIGDILRFGFALGVAIPLIVLGIIAALLPRTVRKHYKVLIERVKKCRYIIV
jgi:hypothetical protein